MGSSASSQRHIDEKVQQVAQFAGIDNTQLNNFKTEFMRLSRDGRMGKKEFMNYYGKIETAGGRHTSREAMQLFNAMDTDNNGYITFDEFLTGLLIFHGQGNPQDRFIFIVESYAGPDAEYVDVNQGEYMLNKFNKMYGISVPTSVTLQQIFRGSNSKIPTKQFVHTVMSLPTYSQYFTTYGSPTAQYPGGSQFPPDPGYPGGPQFHEASQHPAVSRFPVGSQFSGGSQFPAMPPNPAGSPFSEGSQYPAGPQYAAGPYYSGGPQPSGINQYPRGPQYPGETQYTSGPPHFEGAQYSGASRYPAGPQHPGEPRYYAEPQYSERSQYLGKPQYPGGSQDSLGSQFSKESRFSDVPQNQSAFQVSGSAANLNNPPYPNTFQVSGGPDYPLTATFAPGSSHDTAMFPTNKQGHASNYSNEKSKDL